jgi:hypothetical protein
LKDSLQGRLDHSEKPIEEGEKQSIKEFVEKVHCVSFKDHKSQLELDLRDQYYSLNLKEKEYENTTNILTIQQYIYMFVTSIMKIHTEKKDQLGNLMFNKDDELIVDFITAASNIRAFNFSIPLDVNLS